MDLSIYSDDVLNDLFTYHLDLLATSARVVFQNIRLAGLAFRLMASAMLLQIVPLAVLVLFRAGVIGCRWCIKTILSHADVLGPGTVVSGQRRRVGEVIAADLRIP